jgi:hypothetical protein
MRETGVAALRTLHPGRAPVTFELPSRELGVVTHDIHRTLAAALP